jgi:hypothetical protein
MAVYGRCQQLNAGLGALACMGWGLATVPTGGPATLGPTGPFGFSWRVAFSLRKCRQGLLDFLGFPWILSPESSVFNKLRGQKRRNFFSPLFRGLSRAGKAARFSGMRKRRIAHKASLTGFPVFCKKLSSRPFSFRPPQSRVTRSGRHNGARRYQMRHYDVF